MTFVGQFPEPDGLRAAVERAHRADEAETVRRLLEEAAMDAAASARVQAMAADLVEEMRRRGRGAGGLDAFMHEYELSNQEGVVLMCLAEALLRVPDADTANKLIRDKIGDADWQGHLGHSESIFVNASTWALMLTGRVVDMDPAEVADVGAFVRRLIAKSGEPVIRQAMTQAMKIIGRQFVMGRTIGEALERAAEDKKRGYRHSFDMLGESALTAADAERYTQAYSEAIAAVGKAAAGRGPVDGPGVSLKLSALHPRCELAQRERVLGELAPRLTDLAKQARDVGIGLCVDAEEADRLDISLDVIEAVSGDPALKGWDGLGLALQTYQKRAFPAIEWLADLARRHKRRLRVRVVKGAYWDAEIKRAQEQGLDGYSVFTRKASTDVSFLACARRILDAPEAFYPQFATHNAHTLAAVVEMAGRRTDYEFQRLHGMGETLYDQVIDPDGLAKPCRIYAPVGSHEDLLAYLVRRLLENGSNSSFVNRIVDENAPVADIVADPCQAVSALTDIPHPKIPLPADLFGEGRRNSAGLDLSDGAVLRGLAADMAGHAGPWQAAPEAGGSAPKPVLDPADRSSRIGTVCEATAEAIEQALSRAAAAAPAWAGAAVEERAAALERAADLLEENTPELLAVCVREAGKTLTDGVPEVREAVDFLRYYAMRARADFGPPQQLPGPTGEANRIEMRGRGVFACISPWNFPLAIFLGQVSAALAAGNAVVAKPAEQTPLIAALAVELLQRAGVPADVLHLLPGDGPGVGAPLIEDPRVSGVVFTGSGETAKAINRALAARSGPIVPLIAETGGQNAMIVDSTALPEQVVEDAVVSAFRSAGQRCSALRVLFVQTDIADRLIDMLAGATEELSVGDPALLATDVGPVIDDDALTMLEAHAERMGREGKLLCQAALPTAAERGTFFAPRAFEIDGIGILEGEVFGPILHVVRYAADRLDDVIGAVADTGYGLTLGIHSRVDATQSYIHQRLAVGNTYVNRNIIGAVVGVQPFGGEGLSGTGPKAGGPRYLHRFGVERTLSVNTAAAGGNAALMSLDED